MGGGASLMVPMKFSVVTEKTVSISKLLGIYDTQICGYDLLGLKGLISNSVSHLLSSGLAK